MKNLMSVKILNKTTVFSTIAAILSLPFWVSPGVVKAADDLFCGGYSRTAVKQYQELINSGCSFDKNDPMWNPDINYHLSWCTGLNVTESMCNEGTQQRAKAVAKCKNKPFNPSLHQRCEEYANRSVNQNISNIGNGCQFTGPRWSSDKSYHYNWCMKNKISKDEIDTHISNRDSELEQCLPYQTMEKNEGKFVVYISDEEERFKYYASGFINEFQNKWQLSQYHFGECEFLCTGHLNFVDSADLAFLAGHGDVSEIHFKSEQPCYLQNKAWGSYSSPLRTGDLEYIVFMSCSVLKNGESYDWRDRWRHYAVTKADKRPFSGLHMAMGYSDTHQGTSELSSMEADEFAENLKDGLPVRHAWYEAVMDYRWLLTYFTDGGNTPVTLYIRPHKDETLDEHDSKDYKYGDPEYKLDCFYGTSTGYDPGGLEPTHEPGPDPTSYW